MPAKKAAAPRAAIIDLGCAKNTVDSESAMGELLSAGFGFSPSPEDADLVLVNTCGFIAEAREESLAHLREMAALKRSKPNLRVVAIGCLAKRMGEELWEQAPGIDGILGLGAYGNLAQLCQEIMAGNQLAYNPEKSGTLVERPRLLLTGAASAYLRVADGCDNRCTYCAVPLIRGGFRSRPLAAVLREAGQLAEGGAGELCLIAQDTTRYGQDRYGKPSLAKLIRQLLKSTPSHIWLRLLYAHPATLEDEVVELLGSEKRLLGYLDLPLQHINNRILRQMGRRVTRAKVEKLLDRLRKLVPNLVLRTSIITGFPGETAAEFKELLEFIKERSFEHLGAFAYSREEGTPAAGFPQQIDRKLAEERRDQVMAVQQELTFRWLDSRLGQQEEILLESEGKGGVMYGRSRAEAPDVDGTIIVKKVKGFTPGMIITACLRRRSGYDMECTPI